MPETLPTPIDLRDGRDRSLKFSSSAISRFEERCGYRPLAEMLNLGMSNHLVQTFLWSGLLWEDKKLTWEQAGDLVDGYTRASGGTYLDLVPPIFEALMEAGIFKRAPKPNGHDPAHDPNALTGKSPNPDSSPTGTGT